MRISDNSKYKSISDYAENLVSEAIRTGSNKAIIHSIPILRAFPKKQDNRIDFEDKNNSIVVLNCKD